MSRSRPKPLSRATPSAARTPAKASPPSSRSGRPPSRAVNAPSPPPDHGRSDRHGDKAQQQDDRPGAQRQLDQAKLQHPSRPRAVDEPELRIGLGRAFALHAP